jgi:hypothetical protein
VQDFFQIFFVQLAPAWIVSSCFLAHLILIHTPSGYLPWTLLDQSRTMLMIRRLV